MHSLEKLLRLWKIKKYIWGLIFFVIIILILTIDLIPSQIDLKVGQPSKSDVASPRTITFIDKEKTEELKNIAADSANKVYEEDNNVNNRIKSSIHSLFLAILIKEEEDKNEEEILVEIQSKFPDLKTDTIDVLIKADHILKKDIEETTIKILDRYLGQKILPADLPEAKENLTQEAMELDFPKEYRIAIADIMVKYIQPNMILNEEASIKKREEAKNQVKPVERTVRQGEMIVRKGDIVSEDDIKVLEALGLQKPQINYLNIIGIISIVITIIIIMIYYIKNYAKDIWKDQKKLILVGLLIVIIIIIAKIVAYFNDFYLLYLVPVAIAPILTTVLIGTDTAVIITVFLSFLVALVFNYDYNLALTSFISGLVGIFSVSKVSQRNDMVRAGFNVSAVMLVLIIALTLVRPFDGWVLFLKLMATGVINGVLVAIFSNGLLPYLENAFDLTSSVRLLELSNPGHPLLKKLLVEAPGTYHHSVIVGNLAESAAENIGANSLLIRVGAYYHDIGKIKRPYFFSDNQFGGDNPHDKLSANLSALIIKSHIKDGIELAKEYKLPKDIIDIIKQHHGSNLISYFYQQALKDSKHGIIEENDFRYDGPRPQSREAAIIMLADIVEAAVRSKQFNRNNYNRIEGLVRELIRNKLTEGQLDESDLTLKDLNIIANSFVKVLMGIYHHRVEYPENLVKEIKRNDNNDKGRDK
jgi:cyclic-di-AMP phosphodiesterase PgpH